MEFNITSRPRLWYHFHGDCALKNGDRGERMPLAVARLEILQVRKLIQCVRDKDTDQISKIAELGIEGVLDYQGNSQANL